MRQTGGKFKGLPPFGPFPSHQPQTRYSQRLMASYFRKLPPNNGQEKNGKNLKNTQYRL
jgi:hypothetical protein